MAAPPPVPDERRWNHNIHHHPMLLAAVPDGARSAIDVGCGEGMLARRLAAGVPRVLGLDIDPAMIALARAAGGPDGLTYRVGDLLAPGWDGGTFDFVACVAALHHLDAEAGLAALASLVAPGGTLAVLGLARSRFPADLPREVAGAFALPVLRAYRPIWRSPSATVWPPPLRYGEMAQLAQRLLPGARFARHVLWRYSIVWRAPADDA
jgi:SAM-dependent methyltransferase